MYKDRERVREMRMLKEILTAQVKALGVVIFGSTEIRTECSRETVKET